MLINFEFSNFQSFKDIEKINLESSAKNEDNSGFFQDSSHHISKFLMIVGPNGGGKSNLLRALSFTTWFMQSSFGEIKPGQQIPVSPHFFSAFEPSTFKLTFIANKTVYEYTLIVTPKRVLFEQLRSKNPKTKKLKNVFKRQFNERLQTYHWDRDKELMQTFEVADNISTLSVGHYLKNTTSTQIAEMLIIRTPQFVGFNAYQANVHLQEMGKFFYEHPDYFDQAKAIICQLDLGLSDITIDRRTFLGPNQQTIEFFVLIGKHEGLGQTKNLEFQFQSLGTQASLWLLRLILPALKSGGTCIIDELDNHLHPELVDSFIKLFLTHTHNPHHAQLIFASHQHHLLNQLEKSQIQLVEKDENCVSHTWRLDEMKGIRADENHAAKYRAGAYGAIPEVELT